MQPSFYHLVPSELTHTLSQSYRAIISSQSLTYQQHVPVCFLVAFFALLLVFLHALLGLAGADSVFAITDRIRCCAVTSTA